MNSKKIFSVPLRQMKCHYAAIMLLLMLFPSSLLSQTYDSLKVLKNHKLQVYYSEGAAETAKKTAARCDSVFDYYQATLGFVPKVKLLILNSADWRTYAAKGAIYGMPHYTKNQTLVVAAQDNPFWKSFNVLIEKLPKEKSALLVKTYSDKNGNLSVQPFFDLLAIHELAHAYHNQGQLVMQRRWMGELFANVMLHTYIAEKEPELLPALTLYPKLVISEGTDGFAFTTLTDFEEKYDNIARSNPHNYGWYQCRLHAAAADIYDAGGSKVITALWIALKKQKEILSDADFANFLTQQVHPSVADVMLKWDTK